MNSVFPFLTIVSFQFLLFSRFEIRGYLSCMKEQVNAPSSIIQGQHMRFSGIL
jgi:hypothetical protein